jgi:phosphomannomutase
MIPDHSIFRAYDMRGTYPGQINEHVAYAVGQAFVTVMGAKTVVVGRDVRATGTSLKEALTQGIIDAGASVIDIGVISTEMLYFASDTLECDGGISVTASHNPAQWNGFKFIGPKAKPLTKEEALGEIYTAIQSGRKIESLTKGNVRQHDLLPAYISFLETFAPKDMPALKVVANVNFGANGKVVDAAIANLPLTLTRLNWEEDGTFPKGTPDPLLPSNRKEITARIPAEQAHFGVAWDADADRCFFYDEQGRFFHGAYITALLISHFLRHEVGGSVICERRLIRANEAAAKAAGGTIHYSRTGHGYIKAAMREHNAIFGGESSGHFYFRDAAYCDNGMVTFLVVMDMFAKEIAAGRTVGQLLDYYLENFPISLEERNYTTDRAKEIINDATAKWSDGDVNLDDGLAVTFPTWRLSLRSSSNEPVMRLNVEAATPAELAERESELISFIASYGAVLRDDHA